MRTCFWERRAERPCEQPSKKGCWQLESGFRNSWSYWRDRWWPTPRVLHWTDWMGKGPWFTCTVTPPLVIVHIYWKGRWWVTAWTPWVWGSSDSWWSSDSKRWVDCWYRVFNCTHCVGFRWLICIYHYCIIIWFFMILSSGPTPQSMWIHSSNRADVMFLWRDIEEVMEWGVWWTEPNEIRMCDVRKSGPGPLPRSFSSSRPPPLPFSFYSSQYISLSHFSAPPDGVFLGCPVTQLPPPPPPPPFLTFTVYPVSLQLPRNKLCAEIQIV